MFATKSVTSSRQTHLCRSNGIWSVTIHGKVCDKVCDSPQITKVSDMICVII